DLPVSYAGGSPLPAVTALDGPGSEGLGLRQTYTVTATGRGAGSPAARAIGTRTTAANGRRPLAVPAHGGPLTLPDDPALAAQGVYELPQGVRVFVGQREECCG